MGNQRWCPIPVGLGGVTYVQTMSVVLEQNWLEQAWGKVP